MKSVICLFSQRRSPLIAKTIRSKCFCLAPAALPALIAAMPEDKPAGMSAFARILLGALRLVLAVAILAQEAFARLYRPLIAFVASFRLMSALEAAVRHLPAHGVLAALALPLIIAEPAKMLGLWWLATGSLLSGLVTLALAYALSLLLVERILHAGLPALLTLRWFAWAHRHFVALRERVLGFVRSMRFHAFARQIRAEAHAAVQRLRVWAKRLRSANR